MRIAFRGGHCSVLAQDKAQTLYIYLLLTVLEAAEYKIRALVLIQALFHHVGMCIYNIYVYVALSLMLASSLLRVLLHHPQIVGLQAMLISFS